MKHTQSFSFERENLEVDFISFRFTNEDDSTMISLAKYLFNLGFNSYQKSGKEKRAIVIPIFTSSYNKHDVMFLKDGPFWKGFLVQFPGEIATIFYRLIQDNLIDWRFFSSAVLSRFDLCYCRIIHTSDTISVSDFLQECLKIIQQTNKNVILEKNKKGSILRIGNRRSLNKYRVYQRKNILRFEYEIANEKILQKYQPFLVENQLQQFEFQLFNQYLYFSGKTLPLHYSYLDWLAVKLRPIRKQIIPHSGLKTHYIKRMKFFNDIDCKHFFTLLQFLVYVENLDYDVDSLGSTNYRRVILRLQDFLKYQNPNVKSSNHYQIKKLIEFFSKLQGSSLIQFFSDSYYRSLVTIPEVKFQKGKHNSWIATVWIAEELFYYTHPFLLPNLFMTKSTKHNFDVQFKVIQVFCSVDIEKKFFIREFFDSYPSTLNNQQKTKIKNSFIDIMLILLNAQLILPNYKIFYDGKLYDTDKLTSSNISEGFIVYEKLSF